MLLFVFETEADKQKFEALYGRYKRLMLHKAYEILRDYSLAEDAVSEAFIRVFKNLHKIEAADSPRTAAFLMTIVRNASLTMVSKAGKHRAEEISELEDTLPDSASLEDAVMADMSHEEMLRIMGSIGEETRDIFLMKYAHGCSNGEIARLLGISENHVAVKLHRAKARIAAALRKEGYA